MVGELVGSGIKLEILPSTLTTWSNWLAAHPDTTVLDVETGVYPIQAYLPEKAPGSSYSTYRGSAITMFPVPERSDALPTKSRVYGLTFNGQARTYPQETLNQTPVINDSLGGGNLLLVTPQGGGTRSYQRDDRNFLTVEKGESGSSELILIDDEGLRWRMGEDALVSIYDPTMRLLRLPGHSSFWFGWYAFYPATEVYATSS